MRHNKKASLELGINAIVILILAITMLGLGLAFLKNMFGGVLSDLESIRSDLKQQVIDKVEAGTDRLVFLSTDIQVKGSSKQDVYYGIRNDLEDGIFLINDPEGETLEVGTGAFSGSTGVVGCFDALDSEAASGMESNQYITFEVNQRKSIKKGQIEVMKMIIKPLATAPKTTYSCAMQIYSEDNPDVPYARQDFFVTIT